MLHSLGLNVCVARETGLHGQELPELREGNQLATYTLTIDDAGVVYVYKWGSSQLDYHTSQINWYVQQRNNPGRSRDFDFWRDVDASNKLLGTCWMLPIVEIEPHGRARKLLSRNDLTRYDDTTNDRDQAEANDGGPQRNKAFVTGYVCCYPTIKLVSTLIQVSATVDPPTVRAAGSSP